MDLKMMNRRWQLVVMALMVCALSVTGCKKKPKAGAGGLGVDGVGGVTGSDIYGTEALGERMEGGAEQRGMFSTVYFGYDSAQVDPAESSKIEAVAEHLKANPSAGITVEGHCDERGSNDYNLALGERRALAVRAYLIGLGVDAGRVQTKSLGEESPAAPGHDESAWSQNRRAEFVLF